MFNTLQHIERGQKIAVCETLSEKNSNCNTAAIPTLENLHVSALYSAFGKSLCS
jgi:hypothetical protein